MNYFVYILKNKNDQIYIGQTNNLEDRLKRHNSGTQKYTKNKGPFELVYCERYLTRSEAMGREKTLKSGQGREWIRKNIGVWCNG